MPSTCEIATLLFVLSSHCFIGVFSEDSNKDNLDLLEGLQKKPSRKLAVTKKKKTLAATKCKKNYSVHEISTVNSLFNCDLSDSECVGYFYPRRFFDSKCGIGRKFDKFNTEAKEMKNDNTLWLNMPSIGFPTVTLTKEMNIMGRKETLYERLSFIHIHKSGGTSLHMCYNSLLSEHHATLVRHRWFIPGRTHLKQMDIPDSSRRLIRKPTKEEIRQNRGIRLKKVRVRNQMSQLSQKVEMIQKTEIALSHATTYPNEFGKDDHVIFAVIRDPTDRFISSLGQAMGGSGSLSNKVGKIMRDECLKKSAKETLRCSINFVKERGFWFELHFTPQVIDMSFSTMWKDIPIAILPFESLPSIVKYFGMSKDTKGRDGSVKDYRSDEVLTEMSTDDYDDDMLRDVCEIYEVDVVMQRSLGMEVPRCDPFIPKK